MLVGTVAAMITDPILTAEYGVITASLIFLAWWYSPRQHSTRRREDARRRVAFRRELRARWPHGSDDRADEPAPSKTPGVGR